MSSQAEPNHPIDGVPTEYELDLAEDKLHEECGVFGVYGQQDAAALVALGLHALQHRGQEAAGIVTYDGTRFHAEKRVGLVGDHFSKEQTIARVPGSCGIGHVRYSTTGATALRNVQPMFAELSSGGFAICHNGNLTNAMSLRREMIKDGAIFHSSSDTEVILQLVAQSRKARFAERFIEALHSIEGAYSLVAMTNKKLIGVRDPYGIRPLVLGDLNGSPVLASETCALDIIGATFVREVENGELIIISEDGIESLRPFPPHPKRPCIFEYIYFSRPDSILGGKSVYECRKRFGYELAKESPVEADVVIPVPDSGVPSAVGFAQESGIPFELGIIRNHYVGRTFIEPTQQIRALGVKLKHNANRGAIEGKRIVLVDDSIVRGTTSIKIVQMMYDAGATEVHMRVASPPIKHPDFYGIDTPNPKALIAATHTIEEIAAHIGVTSLAYISIDGVYRAMGYEGRDNANPQFTDHSFTGDYPTALTDMEGPHVPKQLSLLAEAG
ncbi:MAG: amidophosphoribosyltransferase [Alphaproteobacteria bacterium]|nr:amidophosphoribosyltransferase [Alphaproteobacteria bacterium]